MWARVLNFLFVTVGDYVLEQDRVAMSQTRRHARGFRLGIYSPLTCAALLA